MRNEKGTGRGILRHCECVWRAWRTPEVAKRESRPTFLCTDFCIPFECGSKEGPLSALSAFGCQRLEKEPSWGLWSRQGTWMWHSPPGLKNMEPKVEMKRVGVPWLVLTQIWLYVSPEACVAKKSLSVYSCSVPETARQHIVSNN